MDDFGMYVIRLSSCVQKWIHIYFNTFYSIEKIQKFISNLNGLVLEQLQRFWSWKLTTRWVFRIHMLIDNKTNIALQVTSNTYHPNDDISVDFHWNIIYSLDSETTRNHSAGHSGKEIIENFYESLLAPILTRGRWYLAGKITFLSFYNGFHKQHFFSIFLEIWLVEIETLQLQDGHQRAQF